MKVILSENIKNKIIEELSDLEHKQWETWSKDISKKENISEERAKRWEKYWISYDKLDEETKEEDRKWARKIIKIIEKYYKLKD